MFGTGVSRSFRAAELGGAGVPRGGGLGGLAPGSYGYCQMGVLFFFLLEAVFFVFFFFFWSRFLFVGSSNLQLLGLLSAREGSRCRMTIQGQ
jgi:hypothetical protein